MTPRRVLLLGGIDPCGGAGITADVRVLAHHQVDGLPVALACTVQNRHGFRRLAAVPADLWQQALAAALADGEVHAIKIGLCGEVAQLVDLAAALAPLIGQVPVVVDPVLSATAGGFAPGSDLVAAYRRDLLPLATVVTPNLPELGALAPAAGSDELLRLGSGAVLLKGGHGGGETVVDRLHHVGGQCDFRHARLPVGPVHGTGCALASALAAQLARGAELDAAAAAAVQFVHACLQTMGPADASGLPRPLVLPSRTSPR